MQGAPEETILYSLILGRSELIMFGGIQKDVSALNPKSLAPMADDTVSNTVYLITPPVSIV